MTTRDLEIFSAVVACGSMSGAARKLCISQSSVSQVVSEIEREYGVLLFERYAHSLHLTHTGKTLLEYARQTLHLIRETDAFLRSDAHRSELRVGASVTVGSCVLCPILQSLREEEPGLRAEVFVSNTHEVEEKLLKSELDIGLVEGRITHPDLVTEKAMEDRLVLICGRSHPFFGRPSVRPEELEGQPLILREEGSGTRARLEEELRRRQVVCDVQWVCNNTEAIQNAVIHGFGVSVLSQRMAREGRRKGLLWACRVEEIDLSRSFVLVHHKNKYTFDLFDRFRRACLNFGRREEPEWPGPEGLEAP